MVTYEERLQRIWETPANLLGQLTTVDHKAIGLRYIVTASTFFLIGGLLASLMRIQLAGPELRVLSPGMYNQLFTMHGVTMIFLFATPMLTGFGNYVLPLMLGTRDMAFPRLNAFGYWVFLLSGIFIFMSFLTGGAPDVGWFNYVPLSDDAYSLGARIEYYTLGLIFLGISTTSAAINFIVTILKLRAPGMTLSRMPLFAWAVLVTSFLIIFALPSLTAANLLLELDRKLGTHFFNPLNGGDPVLWQHLFWIFGHPDVYIIFLPAAGIVSTIVPAFSRTPITGYLLIVLATVTIGFLSFGVWVHHMFTAGLLLMPFAFFSAASHMIAIPSGIQVFAWINTIWQGNRLAWKTPFLFVLGFIVTFVLGGITGVMVAIVPFDWLVHDSYFVVAHFHYVLVGGAVFPIFAGLYYWLPKMTGRMLSEGLGQLSFWLTFIGFNVAFFPMHLSGLIGMPRRIYTYLPGLEWGPLALLSTIGVFILAGGVLATVWNIVRRVRSGPPAGNDPWEANTLEWAVSSPPPAYNFRTIPVVRSRDPLWDQRDDLESEYRLAHNHERETLGTTLLDAEPEEVYGMPGESLWPLMLAFGLALVFTGLLVDVFEVLVILSGTGALISAYALLHWTWTSPETAE